MRIAVVGCGSWGSNHIRTLAGLGALAAVADLDADRAAKLAAAYGCEARPPERLLDDESIEAVVVALLPSQNAEWALSVLRAGRHLLVEKPMALDIGGAEAILHAARASGKVAMTGHLMRFHPAFETLEALVRDGALGQLRHLRSVRAGLGRFLHGADVLWDLAPHDLSLILALAGQKPVRVHAEKCAHVAEGADIATLHLDFASGLSSTSYISRLAPVRERALAVAGERAMAVFDELAPPGRQLALYRHRVTRRHDGVEIAAAEPEYPEVAKTPPLQAELEHFMHCIRTGEAPRAGIAEGVEVLRVIARAAGAAPVPLALAANGRRA